MLELGRLLRDSVYNIDKIMDYIRIFFFNFFKQFIYSFRQDDSFATVFSYVDTCSPEGVRYSA